MKSNSQHDENLRTLPMFSLSLLDASAFPVTAAVFVQAYAQPGRVHEMSREAVKARSDAKRVDALPHSVASSC